MQKYKLIQTVIAGLLVLTLNGCKTTALVTSERVNKNAKVKEVIKAHQQTKPDFKTLNGSVSVAYANGDKEQSVNLSFRMEKDKAIWLSAPLGIAKVFITPEKASYYNKWDNTYFDGDFSYISDLLGFEVDFQNLQNLLLGQSIYPLEGKNEALVFDENYYLLTDTENVVETQYGINPGNFRLGRFEVSDPQKDVEATVAYTYQQVEKQVFPATVRIVNRQKDGEMRIDLDFKGTKLNTDVSFPFKIPSGAKPIQIK